jgi:hypothetical protein
MLVYQRVSDHESRSLSSVSDSNLYILQYRRRAELGRLTLAQEKQVGLKAADGICKQKADQLRRNGHQLEKGLGEFGVTSLLAKSIHKM